MAVHLQANAIQLSASSVAESLFLNVVEHEGKGFGLLTVVLDRDGGGSLDLPRLAFLVVLAVAKPLTELITLLDLDQRDAAGLGESLERMGSSVGSGGYLPRRASCTWGHYNLRPIRREWLACGQDICRPRSGP